MDPTGDQSQIHLFRENTRKFQMQEENEQDNDKIEESILEDLESLTRHINVEKKEVDYGEERNEKREREMKGEIELVKIEKEKKEEDKLTKFGRELLEVDDFEETEKAFDSGDRSVEEPEPLQIEEDLEESQRNILDKQHQPIEVVRDVKQYPDHVLLSNRNPLNTNNDQLQDSYDAKTIQDF